MFDHLYPFSCCESFISSEDVYKIDQIAFEDTDNAEPRKNYLFVDTQKSFFICRKISYLSIEDWAKEGEVS